MKYRGWTNYETWCVNLWLNSDKSTHDDILLLDDSVVSDSEYGKLIKDYVENLNPLEEASMFTDLLNGAIEATDFTEIAKGFRV